MGEEENVLCPLTPYQLRQVKEPATRSTRAREPTLALTSCSTRESKHGTWPGQHTRVGIRQARPVDMTPGELSLAPPLHVIGWQYTLHPLPPVTDGTDDLRGVRTEGLGLPLTEGQQSESVHHIT